MDRWVDGWIGRSVVGCMDRWVDRRVDEWMDG